jgi:hypothetical protein
MQAKSIGKVYQININLDSLCIEGTSCYQCRGGYDTNTVLNSGVCKTDACKDLAKGIEGDFNIASKSGGTSTAQASLYIQVGNDYIKKAEDAFNSKQINLDEKNEIIRYLCAYINMLYYYESQD